MDLKTFVAESLKQIAEAIKEAQAADTGAWIAPRVTLTEKGYKQIGNNQFVYTPEFLTFDVAVTAIEGDQVKGSGGIQVLALQIGGGAEHSMQNTTVSRIQFSIPVAWPEQPRPTGKG